MASPQNVSELPIPASTILPTDNENGVCTGQLDGTFTITPDGNAQYSLSLWVPPGRNGLQPDLALQYDSRAGYGLMGVGGTLTGIPRIARCKKTISHDGRAEAIRFDASDPYCLGGERLIVVNGVNSEDGSEYRTRRESFSRIVIKGVDQLGPLKFELYKRDGRILTFDADVAIAPRVTVLASGPNLGDVQIRNDEVRYSWSLRRVEDRNGNFMQIDYAVIVGPPFSELKGEFLPTQIRYTGSSDESGNLPPLRSVRFFYGSHPEAPIEYVSGLQIRRAARLERIEMWGPSPTTPELLRLYEIAYTISKVTRRSLVSTIRECDGWATAAMPEQSTSQRPISARTGNCKRPVILEWEVGSERFADINTTIKNVQNLPAPLSGLSGRILPLDLNGDGRDDLLYAPVSWPVGFHNHYAYSISLGNDLGPVVTTDLKMPIYNGRPIPIDYNMDGFVDLIVFDDSQLVLKDVVQNILLRSVVDPVTGLIQFVQQLALPVEIVEVADLVGDRLPDLITSPRYPVPHFSPPAPRDWSYWRNNGDGFDSAVSFPLPNSGDHRILDIDGDGAMEVLCSDVKSGLGARYMAFGLNKAAVGTNLFSDQAYIFVDLNGDGLVDAVSHGIGLGGTSEVSILINTGNGFLNAGKQKLVHVDLGSAAVRVIDYDLDGQQELLVRPRSGLQNDPMYVVRWDGTKLTELPVDVQSKWNWEEEFEVFEVLDIDGDGLGDFVMMNNASGSPDAGSTLHLYVRMGKRPDMLTSIQNSFGWKRSIRYEVINDPTVYRTTQGCDYPLYASKSKRWVVAQVAEDDGNGGSNHYKYTYEDGRTDLRGEGFLGFLVQEVTHTETKITTRKTFDLATNVADLYPLSGVPVDTVTHIPLSAGLERVLSVHTDYGVRVDPTGRVVFPFARTIHETEIENRAGISVTIRDTTTNQEFDEFGNLVLRETSWPDGSKEIYHATYAPRLADWLISLAEITEFTSVDSFGLEHTRRSAYVYDDGGLLKREIIEPGKKINNNYAALPPQADGVQTRFIFYTRNPDGTVSKIIDTDSAMPAASSRSTAYTYDSLEHMFPTSSTNKFGHRKRTSYHPGLGLPAISEDENGIRTKYQYDRLGRLRHVVSPDGNDISISYAIGSILPLAVPGVLTSGSTYARFSAGPEVQTTFDTLGRPIVERRMSRGDGRAVLRRAEFDRPGRLYRVSDPHFEGDTAFYSTYWYDNFGRLVSLKRANGAASTYVYHDRDVISLSKNCKYTLDDRGRITQQIEAANTADQFVTTYEYGPFSQLTKVSDAAGVITRIEHDRLGRTVGDIDPNTGKRTITYSAFGEPLQVKTSGLTLSYHYDDLGRVKKIDSVEGSTLYTWDTSSQGIGKISWSTTPEGVSLFYGYDSIGRLSSKKWTMGGDTYEIGVNYDHNGRLKEVVYPKAGGQIFKVGYEYGAYGELQQIVDATTGGAFWTMISSDASGKFTREQLGNGIITESFDNPAHRGLLRRIHSYDSQGKVVQDLVYDYDSHLNVTRRVDQLAASDEVFKYDGLDRLIRWNHSTLAGPQSSTWHYDSVGNVEFTIGPFGKTTYTYDQSGAGPNAVSSSSLGMYKYDGRGNQIEAPGRKVTYTWFDLPRTIKGAGAACSFEYDGENRCVRRITSVGDEIVSLGDLYQRRTRTNVSSRTDIFLFRVGSRSTARIERQSQKDKVAYLHEDHLRSVNAISDDSGAILEQLRYQPFGLKMNSFQASAASAGTEEGFDGFNGCAQYDALKLIDMRGRWYDPAISRFLSCDPIRALPSSGQAQNAYSYVMNNPLTWRDPTGFSTDGSDESDLFISLVQRYLLQHPSNSWSTLDAAVDWAHGQTTAAGAISNDNGLGGAGITDITKAGGAGLGRSLAGLAFADTTMDRLRASPGVFDASDFSKRVQIAQQLGASYGGAESLANQAFEQVAARTGGTPLLMGSSLIFGLSPLAFLGGMFGWSAITGSGGIVTTGTGAVPNAFGILANRFWGKYWEDVVVAGLRQLVPPSFRILTQVRYATPFGLRVLDVVVLNELGEWIGAVEAKAGLAVYSYWQQVKDAYIMAQEGTPIFLYRIPWSKPWFPWGD
jgi:RHS repeat-associated protein